jgi:superfamily II DNA helicase RecQ
VLIGDEVALWGGYEGTVVGLDGADVVVRLATGAEMQVPTGDVTRVARRLPTMGTPDPELAAALRSWRLETSRRLGVPAYVVFNDRTLDEIAGVRPTTERALISVNGIGPRKLEDFGDEILELVAHHLGEV